MQDNPAQNLYHYRAMILGVYDGDTIDALVDLGMCVKVKQKIRLVGINAPEIRGPEKKAGTRSRDALRGMVLGKEVIVQTFKDSTEKYGRYLGRVFVEGKGKAPPLNVNQEMIKLGMAVAYMGDKTPA